jgi:transposase-like protein
MCAVDQFEEVVMSKAKHRDIEKERHWQRIIREAARSGKSIREFCQKHDLKESRFYWWQRKLKDRRQEQPLTRRNRGKRVSDNAATFALVSDEPGALAAGIELVLSNGRRLRIGKGVDAGTLRTVLTVVERQEC